MQVPIICAQALSCKQGLLQLLFMQKPMILYGMAKEWDLYQSYHWEDQYDIFCSDISSTSIINTGSSVLVL